MTVEPGQGILQLGDAQFDDAWSDAVAPRVRVLNDEFLGFALDAPRKVDLTRADDFRVVGVRHDSIRNSYFHQIERDAVLVTYGPDAAVRVGMLAPQKDPRPDPSDPDAEPSEGTLIDAFDALVRQQTSIPWRVGSVKTTALLFDRRTNTVATELVHPRAKDPEVAAWVAMQKKLAFPPAVRPLPGDGPVPRYRREESSPPMPTEPGIALHVPRVERASSAADKKPLVLRGTFRLPLQDADLVKPEPAEDDPDHARWRPVGDDSAKAVVRVTLVATGSSDSALFVNELRVPVYEVAKAGDAQVGVGWFAVDLTTLPEPLGRAQPYAVWAISADVFSAPALVTLVPPELIPEPGE